MCSIKMIKNEKWMCMFRFRIALWKVLFAYKQKTVDELEKYYVVFIGSSSTQVKQRACFGKSRSTTKQSTVKVEYWHVKSLSLKVLLLFVSWNAKALSVKLADLASWGRLDQNWGNKCVRAPWSHSKSNAMSLSLLKIILLKPLSLVTVKSKVLTRMNYLTDKK